MKIIKENFYVKSYLQFASIAQEKAHQRTIKIEVINNFNKITFHHVLNLPDIFYITTPYFIHLVNQHTHQIILFQNSIATNCFYKSFNDISDAVDFFWNSPFYITQEPLRIYWKNDPKINEILQSLNL